MSDKKNLSHHGVTEKGNCDYSNETMKLLLNRASCRNFSDKKIPEDILDLILEAGTHAPTGGNLQPYSIIKIENKEAKVKLAKLCEQNFILKAPIDLLFCIDWHRIKRWAELEMAPFTATSSFRHFWISFQDTIISAQNISTAADALGLGSVYVGTIIDFVEEIRKMFELPEGVFPVVMLCIGYPLNKALPRKKLGPNIVVHSEKYHELPDEELLKAFDEKYPGVKVEATEERLKLIREVGEEVQGKEFAKKCIKKIKENGYINPAQRYFGLHYIASIMPKGNENYLKLMEESGFNWFKKYNPKTTGGKDD
jgi:FMN reductase [NAD(P)H]